MVEVKPKRRVRHNGRQYREGEVIADLTVEEATALVESGAVDWLRAKPGQEAKPEASSSVDDPEEAVKQYHRGFGNYEIPGVGMVKGREAAIEALRNQSGE